MPTACCFSQMQAGSPRYQSVSIRENPRLFQVVNLAKQRNCKIIYFVVFCGRCPPTDLLTLLPFPGRIAKPFQPDVPKTRKHETET